jgi:3-hydroxyacyl-CoA dehydrogenase
MNESLFALQSGEASVEEIDKAVCDYVMPIGPLALRDMNGADIGLAVARFNYQEYGERFAVPQLLEEMVSANLLGQKTMGGFYAYDSETRKRAGVNPALAAMIEKLNENKKTAGAAKNNSSQFSAERLFLPMINEAFLAMQERICQPEDLDAALMAGLGMRRGPLTLASEIGLAECLKLLQDSFDEGFKNMSETGGFNLSERFRPAPLLKRFVWAGRSSVM